jgi:heme exporter protein D
MNWNSWSEFFAMGGYAWYVWGSLSALGAAACAEVIVLARRRKSIAQPLAIAPDAASARHVVKL